MRYLVFLFAVVAALGADLPRITYSKSFPGSVPPYVEISVDKNGMAVYKESADDESPLKFRLTEAEASEVFALAAKLDHFRRPLESGLKVAKMGKKSFRYEDGNVKNEVHFNFSQDLDARTLTDWFERMTETEQQFINLQRTTRFDKLGVNQALIQLQAAHERKRLVAPEQFLPLLERIVKNDTYMHMSRERAAGLAEAFRASTAGKSGAE
ncbi:MAG TPA: hypothetical protein VFQ79_10725 [Bryobacteraceae bacterium]|nr:hypothetical protein [Bryobacteraceae bacterium]